MHTLLAYGLIGFIGLCIGSFLNVVIHRLPRMQDRQWRDEVAELLDAWGEEDPAPPLKAAAEQLRSESAKRYPGRYNLAIPRSKCPHCDHAISAWENIPVISYVFLKGRCRGCRAPISIRYPLVELLTGGLTLLAASHFGFGAGLAASLLLIWVLLALFFIDMDTQLLPDCLTLPLMWVGLLLSPYGGFQLHTLQTPAGIMQSAITGAALGYLVLWSVYWLFKLLTGKEGMGYGDFKLLAALGAWFGPFSIPLIILVGSVSGILGFSVARLAGKLEWHQRFAFGPYLAIGGLVALFWGQPILTWYLGA